MTEVKPYIPGRQSMTVQVARQILARKDRKLIPEWVLSEARQVATSGEYWVKS